MVYVLLTSWSVPWTAVLTSKVFGMPGGLEKSSGVEALLHHFGLGLSSLACCSGASREVLIGNLLKPPNGVL